jgi:hypothetical protein
LSHRPETNAKKEGKEFVKFVDGLANVAGKYAPAPTTTELVVPALVDPYDLLAEVFAVQQPQKRFRHTFDPLKHSSLKRIFPASCHSARRLSASSRLCHQSSTRNPWTLARDTTS